MNEDYNSFFKKKLFFYRVASLKCVKNINAGEMEELMAKILSGEASKQEQLFFYQQLDSNPDMKDEFMRYKNLFVTHTTDKFSRVNARKKEEIKKIIGRIDGKNRIIKLKRFLSYAAVLVGAMILMHILNTSTSFYENGHHQLTSVISESQSTNRLMLSDGSTIWLNANSEINVLSEAKKEVVLSLKGEALFDIIHDENRQFIVIAGGLRIVDKGTKFNVKSNEHEGRVKATLLEGAINIHTADNVVYSLQPGQEFSYQNNKGNINEFDLEQVMVGNWVSKEFIFRNTRLEDIAEELEQWYGVEIAFESEIAKNVHFSGNLDKSISLDNMMRMINYSTGIKYKISEEENSKKYVTIK